LRCEWEAQMGLTGNEFEEQRNSVGATLFGREKYQKAFFVDRAN